ncbi:MAG TPA: hypothetical protein VGG28_30515 [Kofleriaceae bacterium]
MAKRAPITPAFVREQLARDSRAARDVLLKLAVPADLDDAALMEHWQRAIDALRGLDLGYAWGSKQRRARFRELAADREMLAAIQGAAALSDDVPLDMLAVLVADGSDASIDALIPHLGGALATGDDRINWLRDLRIHAADTPRLNAMFAELDATYVERNARSPALELGPAIGLGEVDALWFGFSLYSTAVDSFRAPIVQAAIRVDNCKPQWFDVTMSKAGVTGFSYYGVGATTDRLGLGPCAPAELPAWLARAATTLDIEWEPLQPYSLSSNLRGKRRARLEAWLAGK